MGGFGENAACAYWGACLRLGGEGMAHNGLSATSDRGILAKDFEEAAVGIGPEDWLEILL